MSERRAFGRGLYFEEFEEGTTMTSAGRTVTETDIVQFAGLTGDWTRIHTDAEFAKESMFGERVAHGLLGLAIASGLGVRLGFMEGTVEAFTGLDWKFRGPIKIGDTIRMTATVTQKKAMKQLGGGFVIFDVAVINQHGEKVQRGQWTVLVKSRPADE